MENLKLDRDGRIYNGTPSKFMNMLYDNLVSRLGEVFPERVNGWNALSLYIARSSSVAEKELRKEVDELLSVKNEWEDEARTLRVNYDSLHLKYKNLKEKYVTEIKRLKKAKI